MPPHCEQAGPRSSPIIFAGRTGGESVIAAIRPESLEISRTGWGGNRPNEWPGTVTNRAFLGDAVDHIVQVGKTTLRVRGNPAVSIEAGSAVFLSTDPDKVTLVPVD